MAASKLSIFLLTMKGISKAPGTVKVEKFTLWLFRTFMQSSTMGSNYFIVPLSLYDQYFFIREICVV